jgi:hypothetical protein
MISTLNIRGYINYLFLQRNGSNAPQELLNKWSTLSNEDIQVQLQNLYNSWQLGSDESNRYQQMYLQAIAATMPTPAPPPLPAQQPTAYTPHQIQPHQTQEARPYIASQKSSGVAKWIIGLLLLGCIIGGVVWYVNSKDEYVEAATAATDAPTVVENNTPSMAPTPTVTAEPVVDFDSARRATESATPATQTDYEPEENDAEGVGVSAKDEDNIKAVNQLLNADESRNFDNIYNYYSPSMEKYWDISYPTREELQTRFTKLWQKTSNPKHSNVTVNKIGENTYLAAGLYEYFGLKTKTNQIVSFKTIYKFDENGKIIYENNGK